MPTLPTPGGDSGTWGTELNTYLEVEHAADGTHLNILRAAGSPEGVVTGTVGQVYQRTNGSTGTSLYIKESGSGNTGWVAVAAGGSGAPTDATYIVQTANGSLSAEQALGALATGIVKNTTTTGVLSIAAAGTDYYAPSGTDVAVADGGTGSSTAAAALTALGAMPALLVENLQVASYGLVLADANLCVVMNVGSANDLTVPLNATQAFPTGTVIAIHQRGAGQTSVVATGGVTINSPSGKLKLTGQYSSAALRKFGTNTWVLAGDIAA